MEHWGVIVAVLDEIRRGSTTSQRITETAVSCAYQKTEKSRPGKNKSVTKTNKMVIRVLLTRWKKSRRRGELFIILFTGMNDVHSCLRRFTLGKDFFQRNLFARWNNSKNILVKIESPVIRVLTDKKRRNCDAGVVFQ